MSKKKHHYLLSINENASLIATFPYQYASTKTAHIDILDRGFSVVVDTSAEITYAMVNANDSPLFSDAIKKAILLFVIHTSLPLIIQTYTFTCDGKTDELSIESFPFRCIIEKELQSHIPADWRDVPLVNFILNYKEKYRRTKGSDAVDYVKKGSLRIMAAISAVLSAKSKSYEYERFLYFWMAMNGIYSYASFLYEPTGKKTRLGNNGKLSEVDEMSLIWQFLGWCNSTHRKWKIQNHDKSIIAEKVMTLLKKITDIPRVETLKQITMEDELSDMLRQRIHSYPKPESGVASVPYDISPEIYLIFLLPYYLRCAYFHGNKPFPLVAKNNDVVLHTLRIVNRIMEDFLDQNLPKWVSEEYIESYMNAFSSFVYGQ